MEQLEMDGKLIDALQWGREDAVVEWLAQGASPNAVDTGNTAADRALHKASRRRGSPSLRNLLMAGAEVDMRSGTGATALHTAALSGHAPHITTLLRHGADVTLTLENGSTPLHYGASCKKTEALQALLLGGAELDATNDEGKTALDVAERRGSEHQMRMRDAAKALGESIVPAALPDILPAKADLLAATPEQQGQFNLHNIGFWQQFGQVLDGLQQAGTPLSHADLQLPEQEGNAHLLDYASRFFAEKQVLAALGERGIRLDRSDLMGVDGQPRPYVQAMHEAGTLGQLFTRELWQGQSRDAMQDCHRALSQHFGAEEVQQQLRHYHQLLAATGLSTPQAGRGR